jgi:hypothetical protein
MQVTTHVLAGVCENSVGMVDTAVAGVKVKHQKHPEFFGLMNRELAMSYDWCVGRKAKNS